MTSPLPFSLLFGSFVSRDCYYGIAIQLRSRYSIIIMLVLVAASSALLSVAATATDHHHPHEKGITATSTNHYDPANSINEGLPLSSSSSSSLSSAPKNFLQWRLLQQQQEVDKNNNNDHDDEINPTTNNNNDDDVYWNITSNDYNNDTGVYVTFPSFGIQLGPMVTSFIPSSTSAVERSSSTGGGDDNPNDTTNIANEVSTALNIHQSMIGLQYAIESFLNETFHRAQGDIVNDTNYTTGKFVYGEIRERIQFVSECRYDDDGLSTTTTTTTTTTDTREDGPLLRHRESRSTSTNITVFIPGGRAFYIFGVGGWWMENIPTSEELYKLIIDSVIGKDGDVMGGGGLTNWIKTMATQGYGSESGSSSSSSSSAQGDLSMFKYVQGVKIIEGLTLSPTASPDVANTSDNDDDELVEDTEDINVDADVNAVNEDSDKSIILEATSSSNADDSDNSESSKISIVAGALSCVLVLSIVMALFLYKKRRRDDTDNFKGEGDGTKIVPMSMMSDENDDFYQGYSEVYNGLFSAAGGGMDGDNASSVLKDVEIGSGTRPKNQMPKGVAKEKKRGKGVNAKIVGPSTLGVVAAQRSRVRDAEQSSQQDDSLVPQVGEPVTAETRLHSLGFESSNAISSDNVICGMSDGFDYTKLERSLDRQDSLQRQNPQVDKVEAPYDLGKTDLIVPVVINNCDDGSSVNSIGRNYGMEMTVYQSSKHNDNTNAAYGLKRDQNSMRVKRVTFAENIVKDDAPARDILNGINAAATAAAATKRTLSLSLSPKTVISSQAHVNDNEKGYPSKQTREVPINKEEQKWNEKQCSRDILNVIQVVASRTQSFNERNVSKADPPGCDTLLTTKKDDPPGDDVFGTEEVDDSATIDTDIFSGLRTIQDEEDGTSSTYGVSPIGCGTNLLQQTKELFLCKQVRSFSHHPKQSSSVEKNKKKNHDFFSPPSMKISTIKSNSSSTPPIVSDDEYDSELDLKEEERGGRDSSSGIIIHRPWKDKWNIDPYVNEPSCQRLMMCPTPESTSNYDPDSDWDVSDTEVDFMVVDEDPFVTRIHRPPSGRIS